MKQHSSDIRHAPPAAVAERLSAIGQRLGQGLDRLAVFLERRALWCAGLFSVLYFVSTVQTIRNTPLWLDEIGAYYVARTPLHALLRTLRTGADIQPPLYVLLTHLLALPGNPVLLRIPDMAGVWCMCICTYFFVSRGWSRLQGLFAMFFPMFTEADRYRSEGRPYGLVTGGCALALLCWQSLDSGQRRGRKLFGLWLCCTAVVSIHYYGFLLLIPLCAGEAVRFLRGKGDFRVFAVMALSLAPLAAAYPVIRAVRGIGMTYWTPVSLHSLREIYQQLLESSLLPAGITLIAVLLVRATSGGSSEDLPQRIPEPRRSAELAAVAMFAALPFPGVLLGMVTGAMVSRYVLAAVTGISVGLALLLPRNRRAAGAAVLVSGLAAMAMLATRIHTERAYPPPVPGAALTPDGQPIVYEGAQEFIATHFYAPARVADRMYYLSSPAIALRRTGQDSLEYFVQALGRLSDCHVAELEGFLGQHRRFVMVTSRMDGFPWLLAELTSRQADIRAISVRGDETVYEVTAGEAR